MDLHRADERPTGRGRAEWFKGTVLQDPILDAPAPARVRSVRVSFEPGARTAWHKHPLGQTLHVLSGLGLVQSRGGPLRRIRAGDTVWIPPGEEHWHGAATSCFMSHLAMLESTDEGDPTTWLEPVDDAEYARANAVTEAPK